MAIQNWLERVFHFRPDRPPGAIAPGLYHALRDTDGAYTRFHLRVEGDGTGMLIANATAAARLSPTGVLIVKGVLDGKDETAILRRLNAHFRGASSEVMHADLAQVRALLAELASPGDTYPIFNLEDPALSPWGAQLIAPLQADVPLAPPEQLLPLLDRLWAVGIPHVCLLAPENPEAGQLLRAVERAEDLGLIAGVRGRATDLAQEGLLEALMQAGVDYVRLLYASTDAAIHDALCGAGDHAAATALYGWLEAHELCAVAEMPLVSETLDGLFETGEAMAALGVDNIAFVAYATTDPEVAADGALLGDALPQVATRVEEAAHETQTRFIWNPPVQRDPARSLAAQVQAGPRTSGDVSVRVEPDGAVIPARGPYRRAGNLLTDPWKTIWGDAVFRMYRERVESPTRCDRCPGLTICAADCPREPLGWSQDLAGGA